MRTAIVSGVNGLVGEQLVRQLISQTAYDMVITVARRPTGHTEPKVTEQIIDFGKLPDELTGIEANDGYCCLGTTLRQAGSKEKQYEIDHDYVVNFARRCYAIGVRRFAVVSSIGANATSSNFYLRTKGEMENDLREISFDGLYILRPSLLLGDRKEKRTGEKIAGVMMKVVSPLMVGSLRNYRGIRSGEVAHRMISEVLYGKPGQHVILPLDGKDSFPR